jgi:hypothetical protein
MTAPVGPCDDDAPSGGREPPPIIDMHPKLTELLDYLDRERQTLDRALAKLGADRHAERPGVDRWCAVEVVAHLALIDRRIAKLLEGEIAKAREAGVGPDASNDSFLAAWIPAKVLDRSKRIRNPKADPQGFMTMPEAIAALDEARLGFKAAVQSADGVDLSKVIAPHPAFGPLNGYEWIAFTAAHMARHAAQIDEIGSETSVH